MDCATRSTRDSAADDRFGAIRRLREGKTSAILESSAGNIEWASPEPGLYAHDLADRTGCAPEFYGKPFANAFALVAERLGPGVPPRRIAMVGDTPWTDILGGAAMGWRTVLVHNHGLMRGKDPDDIWQSSGIRPDFLARTT